MDEAVIELLSRYLDADLSATDTERLEERLRNDPNLAAELTATATQARHLDGDPASSRPRKAGCAAVG
jgi:anti-sigma factor RsiW